MTSELEALSRHRLARAQEAVAEGNQLFASGACGGAVNRFYYGAFHAARSLLALRELDSARHSGVIALFQTHFVKTGLVDLDTAKALPRAYEKRQSADYADFATVTVEDAERIAAEVKAFVASCTSLVERLLTIE